jgi:hypothetical protein
MWCATQTVLTLGRQQTSTPLQHSALVYRQYQKAQYPSSGPYSFTSQHATNTPSFSHRCAQLLQAVTRWCKQSRFPLDTPQTTNIHLNEGHTDLNSNCLSAVVQINLVCVNKWAYVTRALGRPRGYTTTYNSLTRAESRILAYMRCRMNTRDQDEPQF